MKTKINVFVIFRILIGGVFLVSGFQKAVGPYQNFLYVIQNYEFLPNVLEQASAIAVPWVELFMGLFLVLGLWLRYTLNLTIVMFCMFITIVTQAIIRKLPVVDCGCFGELISISLHQLVILDVTLLVITTFLIINIEKTSVLSLDQYFSKGE